MVIAGFLHHQQYEPTPANVEDMGKTSPDGTSFLRATRKSYEAGRQKRIPTGCWSMEATTTKKTETVEGPCQIVGLDVYMLCMCICNQYFFSIGGSGEFFIEGGFIERLTLYVASL